MTLAFAVLQSISIFQLLRCVKSVNLFQPGRTLKTWLNTSNLSDVSVVLVSFINRPVAKM